MKIEDDNYAGLKITLSCIFLITYVVGSVNLTINGQFTGLGIWIFAYPLTYGLLHSFVFDKKKIKEVFLMFGVSLAMGVLIILEKVIPMIIGVLLTVYIAGEFGITLFVLP